MFLQQYDVEATAPWLDLLFDATIATAAVWLAVKCLAAWRRRAGNLTEVGSAPVNRPANPDFLHVDTSARAAALQRADAFEATLPARRSSADGHAGLAPQARATTITSFATVSMSLLSLTAMISSAICEVSWLGQVMDGHSTPERMLAAIKGHPIAFCVSLAVVAYHVAGFVAARRWRQTG